MYESQHEWVDVHYLQATSKGRKVSMVGYLSHSSFYKVQYINQAVKAYSQNYLESVEWSSHYTNLNLIYIQ